jgi:hypothetical protein
MKALRSALFIFFTSIFLNFTLIAQNENSILGKWQLQKVSFKKTTAGNSNDKELLLAVFKTAFYEGLTAEQRLNLEDLDWMNAEAEMLRDKYYQTTIEFQPNGAFYNTSQLPDKSLSGEYLLDKKKLLLEWETADKNELKIVKMTDDELVLKDPELKVTYYFLKLKPTKS